MSALGLLLSLGIGVTLGFFGGGGSILAVPLLVYVFGLEPKSAIASSLLIVAAASLAGALQHARAASVDLRTGLVFGSTGMAGAYLGGRAAAFVDGGVLLLLFGAAMLLTALAMGRRRRVPAPAVAAPPRPARLALQGLAAGAFTGLVGAGGGFLIVPALVLFAGLPMRSAIGTSLFVIVLNSLAGFAGYLAHVPVAWAIAGAVAACAITGSFVGAALTQRVRPDGVRRAFAGFVLVMGAFILVREGALVARAAGEALPHTLPQLLFALAVLGIGIAAGRASRSFGGAAEAYVDGDGI